MATYSSPSYVDADTFTVSGDHTADEGGFQEGRAVQMDCGADGVKYGHVLSASYSSPNTTVNLTTGSDEITSNLEEVVTSPVKPGDDGNFPIHSHGAEGDGGTIKLDDLATPDDNTDLDVSTSRHGLCPKLDNDPDHFLDGQGEWSEAGYSHPSGIQCTNPSNMSDDWKTIIMVLGG